MATLHRTQFWILLFRRGYRSGIVAFRQNNMLEIRRRALAYSFKYGHRQTDDDDLS